MKRFHGYSLGRIKCISVVFAVFVSSVVSAGAAPVWQRLETEEFEIISDASSSDILGFAVGYTAFRHAFNEILAPSGRKVPRSCLVLFRRGSAMQKYGPKTEDSDHELLTFTTQVDDMALVAMSISGNRDQALRLAYEFETVWALQRVGYLVPTWMAQGTGMVLSSLELKKGKCFFGDQRDDRAEAFLGTNDLLAWNHFFEISRGSDEYTGKKQAGVFQTQSWALMHWILLGKEHPRDEFEKLAASLRKTTDLEAVQNVTGSQSKDFTKAIVRHLRGKDVIYELSFDEKDVRAKLILKPATEAEVHVQLANILAAANRYAEAYKELDQAVALAPQSTYVKEALARRAIHEERNDDAAKFYRDAIASGSTNPRAYLYSASTRLDEYSSGGVDYAGAGGASTELALVEIRKALALNPGSAEGYRLLGRGLYILPKIAEKDIEELSFGVRNGADGCRVRFYRALLYLRMEKKSECVEDLKVIIADSDASHHTRRSAQDRLAKLTRK